MSLSVAEINQKKVVPVEGLLPALAHRWSPRSFKDEPVTSAELKTVLEAARWAASSSNVQPWRFLVGVKGTETWDKIFATLVPFNQAWAGNAAILILGLGVERDAKGRPNRYALYDLGQAVAQLTAQAAAQGLVTHSMGGYDAEAARKTFGLSADYGLGAVIALGHQAAPGDLADEQMHLREVAARERKPLSEIALTALDTPLAF